MQRSQILLQSYFNQASETYDQVADVQKSCAQILVGMLPDVTPESILDLGAGTGYVVQCLAPHFPQARYSLNDLAPNMLAKASVNVKTRLILGDMELLDFPPHDLIISNLALQWVHDLPRLLPKLWGKSKVLAFSCLLEGSFASWRALFQNLALPIPTHDYPSREVMENLLRSLHPQVHIQTQDFTLTFPNARAVMRYLQQLGAAQPRRQIATPDLKKLLLTHQSPIHLTYKVFFAVLA